MYCQHRPTIKVDLMNIFVLEQCPIKSAESLCDKHVNKMFVESSQLLCSPFPNNSAYYKRTHYNHPCAKWVRESRQNYEWLLTHADALYNEFVLRYQHDHKSKHALKWCETNYTILQLQDLGLTTFAQAMPECYKNPNAITAYRNYYKGEKSSIAVWNKGRQPPIWWYI